MVRLAADNLRFSPLSLVEGEVGGRSSPGEGASATPLALTGRGPGEGGSGTGILPVTPLAFSSPTPWATATALPFASATLNSELLIQNSPTPSVVPTPATVVPTAWVTPSPISHQHAENSQPALTRYYYHANRLYSTCALTDAQGNVVERYQYNAYGLCTTFNANYELPMTFSRFGNPFTFTGRELDPEIEAMHYRSRIYLLRLGLFGQQDPIGYMGGINFYEYVQDNPVGLVDPFGLQPSIVGGITPPLPGVQNPTWTGLQSDPNYYPMLVTGGGINPNYPVEQAISDLNQLNKYAAQATHASLDRNTHPVVSAIAKSLGQLGAVAAEMGTFGILGAGPWVVNGTTANAMRGILAIASLNQLAKMLQKQAMGQTPCPPKTGGAALEPYGGTGGGHHVPAKSAFTGAEGYDANAALAIPNAELARLGVRHQVVTGAQMTGYKAFSQTGAQLTWDAVQSIETQALIRGGMQPETAQATVQKAIQALKDSGVSGPTRIPWGG